MQINQYELSDEAPIVRRRRARVDTRPQGSVKKNKRAALAKIEESD